MQYDDERIWAEKLANKLGVAIPDDIRVAYWSLPLLEKLIDMLVSHDICKPKSSRRPVKAFEVENTDG